MIKLKEYIVSQEKAINNESYSVNLILILFDIDNSNIPEFSKNIVSVSKNSQTGYKVDIQRTGEINSFIDELNN